MATTAHSVSARALPPISPVEQWRALTHRSIVAAMRSGEFVLAIISPVFLAICFYLPLRTVMNMAPGMNYAQFLMPIICLQSVGFAGTSAAMRAAMDEYEGIATRLRTMPVPGWIPVIARLGANVVLLLVSLLWATIAGLAIGWRTSGAGLWNTIGFFGVTLVVGLLLSVGADALALLSGSPQATSQAMALPQLILGMVSIGFVPEERFPEWIRPFARNQPISQFVSAMRGFNEGHVTWAVMGPPVYWTIGLTALVALMVGLAVRKRKREL